MKIPIERSNRLKPKPQPACAISITRARSKLPKSHKQTIPVKSRSAMCARSRIIAARRDAEVTLSGALVEDLTARRTAALRAVLASRSDVALVAATHGVARRVCYETPSYEAGSVLSLSSEDGGCALACKRRRDKQGWSAVVRDPFRMGAGDPRRIERLCGTGCLYRNKAF